MPGELLPVEEDHEVGHRQAVLAVAADLAHQVHAHGVAAEGEEDAVAEREDAGVAPDQVHRQRAHRVAHDLGDQLHRVVAEVEDAAGGHEQVGDRHDHGDDGERDRHAEPAAHAEQHRPPRRERRHRQDCAHGKPPRARSDSPRGSPAAHASALRPFIANRPEGLRWMKMTMKTRTAIFASTAPGHAFEELVEDAEAERGDDRAGELADAADDDDEERVDDVALAEVGADVADLRERAAAEAGDAGAERRTRACRSARVSTPTHDAMRRFWVTPRTNRPSRVLRDQQGDAAEDDHREGDDRDPVERQDQVAHHLRRRRRARSGSRPARSARRRSSAPPAAGPG